ncbi:hypothetical protein BJV78DRAFT_1152690 [Lactifluus subvellereus]|nr:hypothetical protein BJV78DRAFT_1152690 [Lactifluus subvellereus]
MAPKSYTAPASAGPFLRTSASSRPVVRNPPDVTGHCSCGRFLQDVDPWVQHTIDRVRKLFPEKLKKVDRGQIYLTARDRTHPHRGTVRIDPTTAWHSFLDSRHSRR